MKYIVLHNNDEENSLILLNVDQIVSIEGDYGNYTVIRCNNQIYGVQENIRVIEKMLKKAMKDGDK